MPKKTARKKRPYVKAAITDAGLCIKCPSPCCRDVVMMITKPRGAGEIHELKQYLYYDTSSIFIKNYRWFLRFEGTCMYLDENNLCTNYGKRPDRCRRHRPPACELFGEWYDVMLNTPDELEEYLQK